MGEGREVEDGYEKRGSHIKLRREYETPIDLEELTAKDLVDGLRTETASKVLEEYFANIGDTDPRWSAWYDARVQREGQFTALKEIYEALDLEQGEEYTAEIRGPGGMIKRDIRMGSQRRFSMDKEDKEKVGIGIDENGSIEYRIKK